VAGAEPGPAEIRAPGALSISSIPSDGASSRADDEDEITKVHQAAGTPSTDGAQATLIGRIIEGKYRLDVKIGFGGMGSVYRAYRLLIGDEVAIKILHAQHSTEPQATERFRREAQAAARLKHPNAVSVYDFGVTSDGLLYLVMELVEGNSLRHIIRHQGPLTPSAVSEVISQACAALQVAHQQHIVHRDLKPDNIIVNVTITGLRVKVLDFGIAKLRDIAASNLTQTGSVMGTPHYMSPEQCLGEEIDSRSDLYSLGIVMYEMLAGVVPFNSPTSTAVVVQHVNKEPPSLRSINLSITPAVEAVVLHALAKRREDRPQTADALSRELIAAVSPGQPAAAPVAAVAPPHSSVASQPGLTPTMVMKSPASGGTPVYFSPAQGIAPAVSSPSSAVPRSKALPVLAGVAALSILVGAVAVYFIFFSFSAKRAILDEIRKGNLVKPEGNSGYDLFLKHQGKDLNATDKEEIARNAQPKLEQRGDQIFTNLKQDQTESEAEWSEANRIYSWLNELRPSSAFESRIYFSQASITFARKDYNGAIAGYQRASKLQPNWALVLNRMGRCYLNLKDKGSAREYYRQATVAEPAWISPWVNLGGVCLELNDPYSAESALRQATGIDAQKASAHKLLGDALEKQGRPCEALDEFSTALNLATNNPTNTVNSDALRRKITALSSQLFCD
jgi:serine/threonine-protein kinase